MPIAVIALSMVFVLERCLLQDSKYFVRNAKLRLRKPCSLQSEDGPHLSRCARSLFWGLVAGWLLCFFFVSKIPVTAFFVCISSSMFSLLPQRLSSMFVLSSSDKCSVGRASSSSSMPKPAGLLRVPSPGAARSTPSRGRQSLPPASPPLDSQRSRLGPLGF